MALAVEYDDRLKTISVVMRFEEPQLLAAMDRIERVVDVERDPFRDLPDGFAIKIDHRAAHAQKGASVGQVLQTGDVDCEHSSKSSTNLNMGSPRRLEASLPSS